MLWAESIPEGEEARNAKLPGGGGESVVGGREAMATVMSSGLKAEF